jgi:hypothetical protein
MSAQVISFKPRKSTRRSMPVRRPNADLRTREYLTPSEIAKLIKIAGQRSRYGQCDAFLILMAYRHGLRVSELVALGGIRWISRPVICTCAAPRTACPPRIPCRATNCVRYNSSPVSGPTMAASSSCRNAAAR